jgi:HK97 gp10 family phage protein
MPFELKGARETIATLDRIIALFASAEGFKAEFHAGGEVLAEEARRQAPVVSGRLRDGIKVEDQGVHQPFTIVIIDDVPYASFVELGDDRQAPNAFMRRAEAIAAAAVLEKIGDGMRDKIEAAAK